MARFGRCELLCPTPRAIEEQLLWSSAAEPYISGCGAPRQTNSVAEFTFPPASTHVHGLAFDRESRTLIASRATDVIEWDARLRRPRPTSGPVRTTSLGYSVTNPNARLLAGSADGTRLTLCDLDSLVQRWSVPVPATHDDLTQISPDARFVAIGQESGVVLVVHAADGSRAVELGHPGAKPVRIRFSADSSRLSFCVSGWLLSSLGHRDRTANRVLQQPGTLDVLRTDISPDGRLAACGGEDERVHLWDVGTGREVRTLSGFRSTVWSVAFSPNGSRLAVGSKDRVARLFDPVTGDRTLPVSSAHGYRDVARVEPRRPFPGDRRLRPACVRVGLCATRAEHE